MFTSGRRTGSWQQRKQAPYVIQNSLFSAFPSYGLDQLEITMARTRRNALPNKFLDKCQIAGQGWLRSQR